MGVESGKGKETNEEIEGKGAQDQERWGRRME